MIGPKAKATIDDYDSIAQYIATALIQEKSRAEILKALRANGYTRQQASNLYHMNLTRIFNAHQRYREREDEEASVNKSTTS